MATNYVKPFPILDSTDSPMKRNVANYSASLATASKYVAGDLVEVVSGFLQKSTRTTAANIGRLGFAVTSWNPAPIDTTRMTYYTANGHASAAETLPEQHSIVFTYQGTAADTQSWTFTAGDFQAVQAGNKRALHWNTTESIYTISLTTASATVIMKRVFGSGAVGDTDVQVECQLLDDKRMVGQ